MGLPLSSWLDPPARRAQEERFQNLTAHLGLGPVWEDRPALTLVVSGGFGVLRSGLKAGTVLLGAGETLLRERQGWVLLVVPRALVSVLGALAFHGVGKLLSAAQTAVGLESEGRPLSQRERALLRLVFHDALDLDRLRIKSGPCGLAGLTHRPFVHGEVLYLKTWALEPGLLVHEAVHWWQHQHGGPGYMLDSLWSQAFGRGYAWEASVPGREWADLEVEEQAAFIEAAFRHGFFSTGRLVIEEVDLTLAARAAVTELRSGRGAP